MDEDDPVVEAVVAGWRQRTRASRDQTPREGTRGVRERGLVRSLISACEEPNDRPSRLRSVAVTGSEYGAENHRSRVDPEHLLSDLAALRQAAWKVFRLRFANDAGRRIVCFDLALSVAYRTSLLSSHGRSLTSDEMASRLEEIVTEIVGRRAELPRSDTRDS